MSDTSRKPPPQELIDEWAAQYNSGLSLRQVQASSGVSYGTVHRYVSKHPAVTMRGTDGKPRHDRPTERTVYLETR